MEPRSIFSLANFRLASVAALVTALLLVGAPEAVGSDGAVVWANANEDYVEGLHWTDGVEVTLTIDDPATGQPVDYTDSAIAGPSFDPQLILVGFVLDGIFDVQPGHEVALTDGTTTKTHTVTTLQVTGADAESDTVSGTAEPGSDVRVEVWGGFYQAAAVRYEVADGGGNWAADFSTPGDEAGEEVYDIVPGGGGTGGIGRAFQEDADGDSTQVRWSTEDGNGGQQPFIMANAQDDWVQAQSWPLGAEVTLTIEQPGGSAAAYEASAVMEEAPWDPQQTWADFPLGGIFDVEDGQIVTVTDDVTTKTLTIATPVITSIDPIADTISGSASPEAGVCINVSAPAMEGVGRCEMTNTSGQWTADFSTPGDEDWETQTFDIAFGEGQWVDVIEFDEDGDASNMNMPVAPGHGDANCDGKVDAVDALTLLRNIAGLPVNVQPGCPAIGSY